jgi:hypothetical protein
MEKIKISQIHSNAGSMSYGYQPGAMLSYGGSGSSSSA